MGKRLGRITQLASLALVFSMAAGCDPQPGDAGGTADGAPIVKSEPAQAPSDRGDQVVTGGDLAFMNDAAPGGMAEIELGRLAATQASNEEVKRFAERVIADHSKAGEALKQLAEKKKVMLPQEVNPTHKETMAKLSKLKGAAFDRAYVQAMVQNHEKDVTAFESVAQGAVDADVKAFATTTLPTLKAHLQTIRDIAATMGVKTTS